MRGYGVSCRMVARRAGAQTENNWRWFAPCIQHSNQTVSFVRFGREPVITLLLVVTLCIVGNSRAGVTLITHGFNANADDWVAGMSAAIERHPGLVLTNTTTYEIYFELSGGSYTPTTRKLRGSDPLEANSGEIILLLDWSQLAGTLSGVTYSTYDVAPAVASTLTSTNFIPELGSRPLAEQPLHLIGHSRGGSLICEVARILGSQGLWVDHITTLDPHPLNNDYDDSFLTTVVDAPARPYVNVLFADNYYQINSSFLGLDPNGQYVIGAYNRYLTGLNLGGYGGFARQHSNVHLWYHGTVDWETPVSDGGGATITGLERDSWWTDAETNGITAGFHYSLIAGGNRTSSETPAGGTNRVSDGLNQLWDFGAGVRTNRFALQENFGLWPNLLTLNLTASNLARLPNGNKWHSVESGSSLPIRFIYQAGSSQSTNVNVRLFLDVDSNPYSGNEMSLKSTTLASTGVDVVTTVTESVPILVDPGLYTVGAEISDSIRTRYLYAPELLQIRSGPISIAIERASGDSVQLSVAGAAGGTVLVEASSDVASWLPVLTNTQPGTVWNFSLPVTSEPAKFYRAKRL